MIWNFLSSLWRFFFNKTTLVFLGLVLLSFVIWFIGPLVYIKPYQPLGSEAVRWWLIAAVFVIWILRLLLRWWRAKAMNERLLGQLAKFTTSSGEEKPEEPGQEEVRELQGRFQEAIQTLSKTRFGQTEGGFWGRLSKRYIYQLPWYLIIGSPGSGKTTALVNSGLDFPLAEKFGKGAIRGVGGTRNCDWWFTDQAVLLDTAGRYTTQESNAVADKAAWKGFLQLLKRFRVRQPVNGVMVTFSVQELLNNSSSERGALAHTVGQRLAELCDELSIKFPVYVLITKTDLLAGFNEFFGSMNREERAQVWGLTLPYREDAKSQNAAAEFEPEFDAMVQQINRLLPQRLLSEVDQKRRGLIYALPQQFDGLRNVISDTLNQVFSSSSFKEKPMLRGVYFTSGTQEGLPFDRVMTALSRRFDVQSGAGPQAAQSGKSFFIETLLKGVVFKEAGLTGRNAKKEKQLKWLQAGGLALLALTLVGSILGWTLSYQNNLTYFGEVRRNLEVLQKSVDESKSVDLNNLVALLPLLDYAEKVAVSDRYLGTAPVSWRLGLLQVPKVQAASDSSYLKLLEDAWLPGIVQQLHRSLQATSSTNPEASFEALRVYLMMHDAERFDAKMVKAWLRHDWETSLPEQLVQQGVVDKLVHHLDRLFQDRVVVSPSPIDSQLVAEVRQRLAQMSPAQRAYSRIKQLAITGQDLPPDFTLVRAAGPEAPQIFSRRSGLPLTQGISGLFTYDGYHGAFSPLSLKVTTQLSTEEDWVLGGAEGKRNKTEDVMSGRFANEVKRLYLMEYAKTWEDFLADVHPVRTTSLDQVGEQARLYSSANSALELFVRAVANETTLSRRPDASNTGSSYSWLGEKLNQIRMEQQQLARLTGRQVNIGGLIATGNLEADIVDFRFREYRRLANSNGSGPSPMASSLLVINEAAAVIAAARQQIKAGGTVPPNLSASLDRVRAEGKRLPPPMSAMYEDLAATTSSQVGRELRSTIGGNMNAEIGTFCRRVIGGRYPFSKGSSRDVTSDDFARLFGVGGLMDTFFRNTLQPMVDISTNNWSFKQGVDGTPVGGSASLVAFQRAATIRDVFFRTGAGTPSVRIEIKPLDMDATIAHMSLEVDGDMLRYQHGPQIPKTVTWPGTRGTGQIRLQLASTTGESSGIATEGPWALHRLFDQARIEPGDAPEKFFATFTIGGKRIRMQVTASSVFNPFRLRALEDFSCPGHL
jgi:type VI secretion system protein ImpL